jgi:hypothetical protein
LCRLFPIKVDDEGKVALEDGLGIFPNAKGTSTESSVHRTNNTTECHVGPLSSKSDRLMTDEIPASEARMFSLMHSGGVTEPMCDRCSFLIAPRKK